MAQIGIILKDCNTCKRADRMTFDLKQFIISLFYVICYAFSLSMPFYLSRILLIESVLSGLTSQRL